MTALALAALLASGSPERAWARPETPTVTVDGQEAHFDVRVPHKRGDEWFLPTAPIARILGLDLTFDPDGLVVAVTDPREGTTRRYRSVSGELERENQPTGRPTRGRARYRAAASGSLPVDRAVPR